MSTAASAERLQRLKLVLGGLNEAKRPSEGLPAPGLEDLKIPRGTLTELCGTTPILWLMHFLAGHPDLKTFWLEKKSEVLPTAFQQRGVNLDHITFAEVAEDLKKPLRRVLQSQAYDVIVAPNEFKDVRTLRAFQLLTEKSNGLFFLLAQNKPATAWPISLQLRVDASPSEQFQVEILRQKLGSGL